MNYAIITIGQIIAMFVIILCGGILYKKGLITKEGNQTSNNILLYMVNPVVVFNAFQREFDPQLLKNLGMSAVLSFLAILISIGVARLLFASKGQDAKTRDLEKFSCIYTNCSFFGIPLVSSILGDEGVLYISAYLIAFNLLAWTHGLALVTGKADKENLKELFRTPLLPAVAAGFFMFIFGLRLLSPIQAGLDFIGALNTPLAMIVAGVSIAQSELFSMFKQKRIYYTALIGLFIIPLIVTGIFSLLPGYDMVKMVVLIATACPAGAMGTMLAIRFGGDYKYCSQIFAMTTLLSVVTLPVMVMVMQIV
ncbi:MAG: AEC family transporter [Acetivibrio ethanolgignens]